MPNDTSYDVRTEMLEALISKVGTERFPSSTTLDIIESLLAPEDVPVYAEVLLEHVRTENFPSVSMMRRIQRLA
ncbi:hypothetical protein [Nocardioides sp. LS1]|uniref:hypothetical protein n=1 Tax=Nocardioides sp. LS1 TaxID=1027620 RepID=UPI000F62327C|nr:hypothetical protein [Nocardioides sp. LS1]GCD89264.1 hypothetical protein NLS1_12700 [Nocardioides sp. LS1]